MINLSEKLIEIGLSLITPFPLFISAKILFYVLFQVDILENYPEALIIFIPTSIAIIDSLIFLITPMWKEIRSHPHKRYFFSCIVLYFILGIIIAASSVITINPNDDFFIFGILASLWNICMIIVVSASHYSKATNM